MSEDLRRAGGSAWLDSLLYDTQTSTDGSLEAERSSAGVRPWPTETLGPLASERRGARSGGVTADA